MAHAAYPCRLIRLLYVDYEPGSALSATLDRLSYGGGAGAHRRYSARHPSDQTSTQPSRRSPTAWPRSDLSDLSETTKGACLVAREPRSESDANVEHRTPVSGS